MTALATSAIRRRLKEPDLDARLVVSPLLDEDEQTKIGQASIDVRLGFDFCHLSASSVGAISEFVEHQSLSQTFSKYYRREYVPFGASITLHPHQFLLAQTLEYLRLPPDLMAYVAGRSTWGRLGLTVATAIGIHPNFAGCLTLELRNLGETPLTLYPGQTIAQLFFHRVTKYYGQTATDAATQSQYTGTVDMIPQRISSRETHDTLNKLINHFKTVSKV